MSTNNGRNFFVWFWDKIKEPPAWVAKVMYATALIGCPLAIAAVIMQYIRGVFAAVTYLVCALIIIYAVYALIVEIRRLREKILEEADKHDFTRNLHNDEKFRTIFITTCVFLFNIGYTIFVCVMAFVYDSVWYGALTVYNILLTVAQGVILVQNRSYEKAFSFDKIQLQRKQVGVYRYCGIMILMFTVALAVFVLQMVVGDGFHLQKGLIIPFAVYAVVRVVSSVIGFIQSTKLDDFVIRALRQIALAAALVSVLSLQTSLFYAFPPAFDPATLNGVLGSLVCLLNVAIGVYMIIVAALEDKRINKLEENERKEVEYLRGYNREDYYEEYGSLK